MFIAPQMGADDIYLLLHKGITASRYSTAAEISLDTPRTMIQTRVTFLIRLDGHLDAAA
jgi:hypothetical protein